MGAEWGHLVGVCIVLLFLSSPLHSAWPGRTAGNGVSSTTKTLVDPITANYRFDPASANLKLVQVVFRHGARTPLNTIYGFPGGNWTHCQDHYKGVEVALYDENGAPQPPPILDPDNPVLPGGCRQGTLTEAGYGMALNLGTWLRDRYVTGGGGGGRNFLPDLGPADLPPPGAPASRALSAAAAAVAAGEAAGAGGAWGWDASVASLRTTPIRRTVATLRGVLTGLWPRLAGGGGQGGAPVLPVGASVLSREIMYGNNGTCARLGPLHEALGRDLEAADARDAELPRLNRRVAEALGLDPATPINWPKLYDTLAAMLADGLPLPPGASREVLDVVWAQAERHEAAIVGPGPDICASLGPGAAAGGAADPADSSAARARRCREALRLGIGMLVRRLLDNMEAAVAAAAPPQAPTRGSVRSPSRVYLYSGHDSSVMPLLAVLGQPARAWPPFAANVVFELWQAGQAAAARGLGGRRLAGGAGSEAAGGRRGLAGRQQPEELGVGGGGLDPASPGSGSGSGAAGSDSEYWVRILYNGEPLVVPALSNAGGWVPLGLLRQRVMLPYAMRPEEHEAECGRTDVSDLQDPLPPAAAGARAAAAAERERRLLRHAML